jgi:Phosphotransferase enzyme family
MRLPGRRGAATIRACAHTGRSPTRRRSQSGRLAWAALPACFAPRSPIASARRWPPPPASRAGSRPAWPPGCGWPAGAAGGTLLHADLRADNLLLTPARVMVVDWPWASVGAAWFDLLGMLPSVAMQGGLDPEAVFAAHPVAAGADPDAVTATLAALAGFFVVRGGEPPPPGLPTVRSFQLAQGRAALAWLRRRLGWP